MAERRYKCWECHRPGFKESELVSHRCAACRAQRVLAVKENPELSTTAWTEEGQQVWTKDGALGEDGGVNFRVRKKPISKEQAAKRLKKLKELPTWKNGSRS